MNFTLRETLYTKTPQETALWFQTVLAVDRGFESTIITDGRARVVIASDGQAVRFEPPRES